MNELARVVRHELGEGGGTLYGDVSGGYERAMTWETCDEARPPIGFRA